MRRIRNVRDVRSRSFFSLVDEIAEDDWAKHCVNTCYIIVEQIKNHLKDFRMRKPYN